MKTIQFALAIAMAAISLPATGQLYKTKKGEEIFNDYPLYFRVLGLDEVNHDVYWVNIDNFGSETHLCKTHWEDSLLWQGKLPPWLKEKVIFRSGTGEGVLIGPDTSCALPMVYVDNCDGHWEWQGGRPRAVVGDSNSGILYSGDKPEPGKQYFDFLDEARRTNWSADEQLALLCYAYATRQGGSPPTARGAWFTDNDTLLDAIVDCAGRVKNPPDVPESAHVYIMEGMKLLNLAEKEQEVEKSRYDAGLAGAEFWKARDVAPWWPEIYRALASADDLEGGYGYAAQNFRRYLKSKPQAADAHKVQLLIDKLQAQADAAKIADGAK